MGQGAAGADAQRDELHGDAGIDRAVAGGVGGGEGGGDGRDRGVGDLAVRESELDFVDLAGEAHVGGAFDDDVGEGDAGGEEGGAGGFDQATARTASMAAAAPWRVEADGVAADLLEGERGGEEAQSGGGAGWRAGSAAR